MKIVLFYKQNYSFLGIINLFLYQNDKIYIYSVDNLF